MQMNLSESRGVSSLSLHHNIAHIRGNRHLRIFLVASSAHEQQRVGG